MARFVFAAGLSLLLTGFCQAQENEHYRQLVSEAQSLFEEEQYHFALELYERATAFDVHDAEVEYRMAEAYRKSFDYPKAEVLYLQVLATDAERFPLASYYHALMLKLNGNLSEAMNGFERFIRQEEGSPGMRDFVEQAIIDMAGCEIAREEFGTRSSIQFAAAPGAVNSTYNDFAPALADGGVLVITSTRVPGNRSLIDERNGEAFSDNYYFRRGSADWDKRARRFSAANSVYHDGSGSFTRTGNAYYFTVCEQACRIYATHYMNNRWSKPEPLNELINLSGTESRHPGISPGGDTLFFASNRPGGHGSFDIWMSIRSKDGGWSDPVNAGSAVNTKANEVAPAFTGHPNTLFFSSDGHPGYGGYDLFVAKGFSSGDTAIYNLNLPFNSVRDDCFLSFGDSEIWWSSNRTGGKGGFDIYSAQNIGALALVSKLSVKNRNDSRTVTLTSRTARSENLHLLASRNEETIDYNNLTYQRKAVVNRMVANRLRNVENRREDFSELTDEEFQILNQLSHARFQGIMLKKRYASTLLTEVGPRPDLKGPLMVTGRIIDASSGTGLPLSRILLTNEYGDILKITSTNEEGLFRFTDVPGGVPLYLRLENGSGGSVNAFVSELQTTVVQPGSSPYVENIYFDFDEAGIRPEAAQVLKELASFLTLNRTAQVEIYAFADDRGSDAYNFELTQKRGEAVVAFLKDLGVDETSLAIVAKGKQSMHVTGGEIQRQYNRRAEFYLNGGSGTLAPTIKTYILKKDADWNFVSDITGVPAERLRMINGATSEKVKAFQPVRVPVNAGKLSDDLFFAGI